MNGVQVTVIVPALNEARIIGPVIADIRNVLDTLDVSYEVLVVDDGSSDGTDVAAQQAGARVIQHAYNMGNGAAVKTGIRSAVGEIIVMMDGDGQHDPADIPRLLIEIGKHGMVVGARTRDSQTQWYRDLANGIYNMFASYVCGRRIPDLTSGFRAMKTDLARRFVYLLPNTFSYPTTLTLATIRAGHCVKYIPIKTAYRVGKSKIKLLRDGIRFLLIIFKITTLFSPLKVFLPISLAITLLGVIWYLLTLITYGFKMPPASVIMILSGVFFFLMGLISEQIAQLRFDRSESFSPYASDLIQTREDSRSDQSA